jgi:hypothetical protein
VLTFFYFVFGLGWFFGCFSVPLGCVGFLVVAWLSVMAWSFCWSLIWLVIGFSVVFSWWSLGWFAGSIGGFSFWPCGYLFDGGVVLVH